MAEVDTLEKARELLGSVAGRTLNSEGRQELAVKLAALMAKASDKRLTSAERHVQAQLAAMMKDPHGKAFTVSLTDQCFRSHRPKRVADQITYLLKKYGIPRFLPLEKQFRLVMFRFFGRWLPRLFVPLATFMLRRQMQKVVVGGEDQALLKHMKRRRKEKVRVNLNHLGEAILGEEEAKRRLQVYLASLAKPEVEYVSVKISTLFSQIQLLDWDSTLKILSDRLRLLYRAAMNNTYTRPDGTVVQKFVNLDMEEYRDLTLTVELFRMVMDEPEFQNFSGGIVLQSYLPDSYLIQQNLTVWAMQRVERGGAPIKIRLVKGANLAMEKVEAALNDWRQSPYSTKQEVDANFKRMLHYAFQPDHARAANIGVGSHNLFDVAYAMILREEKDVAGWVSFEMLEGMSDHTRRVVQELSGDMLVYCPAAKKNEFQNAVTYLIRRLDENTAEENYLRHSFGLVVGSDEWKDQEQRFKLACQSVERARKSPHRTQDRFSKKEMPDLDSPFHNEPPTDFSLGQNRRWAYQILEALSHKQHSTIPLVIGGEEILETDQKGEGIDPSCPGKPTYEYALAGEKEAERALATAVAAREAWAASSPEERSNFAAKIAQLMRERRGELIGAMVTDGGKTVVEADHEVSEAIDFVEYYRRSLQQFCKMEDLTWQPKGTILVTPPWNFPCAIPMGGAIASLLGGNTVIFKPAPETVLVGWQLAQIVWAAGISKEILQFVNCEDEPVGSKMVKDPRISSVVLTGASDTARHFLNMRPGLDLTAETGGKNAIIITSMADRDLAIKDLIYSAFGHAGQKCSAASLAIIEAELYDDPRFRAQLRDAAASMKVGSPWDFGTRINPLIREPGTLLLRGLTTLEEGEEWLLQPRQSGENPQLWSPGIKLGVTEGSFTHQNELFGPVLGLMRANSLQHALQLANGTKYGLTSGLHSLDEREQKEWIAKIEAGNAYINRGITGAIVRRQPFGGVKESAFGRGIKAGGPNYMTQMMVATEKGLPNHKAEITGIAQQVMELAEKCDLADQEKKRLEAALKSYLFWWNTYFSHDHDPSLLLGQDNILRYRPKNDLVARFQPGDRLSEGLYLIAAAGITGASFELSLAMDKVEALGGKKAVAVFPGVKLKVESNDQFIGRLKNKPIKSLRLMSQPSADLLTVAGSTACQILLDPPLANGRVELLRWLQEISISIDYHRYGNLGDREEEPRAPLATG